MKNIYDTGIFLFVSGINNLLLSTGQKFTSPLGRIFCSSSLKAVPIFRLTVGGSSPGSRGYSLGSFPVNSYKEDILGWKEGTNKHVFFAFVIKTGFVPRTASLMQMLLSSSILCLSVSSSASCLALSAASMSFLAVWELSDSWEPASHGQNVIRGQKSRRRVGCGPVFSVCVCVCMQAWEE